MRADSQYINASPGTTKVHRLEENLGALSISISTEEDQAIRKIASSVVGDRVQNATGYAYADTPAL